jgi:hypothetical protein
MRLEISPQLLLRRFISDGQLPLTANILTYAINQNGNFMFIIHDPSFQPVHEGGSIPPMTLAYKEIPTSPTPIGSNYE